MFNLKEKVQKKMKSSYWNRGSWIFNKWNILNLNLEADKDIIFFSSDIESSDWYEKYDTSIFIDNKTKDISYDCNCPAYWKINWCKHIWWLARKIDKEYEITDSLEIIDKKTREILSGWNKNFLEESEEEDNSIEGKELSNEEIYNKLNTDDDFLHKVMHDNGVPKSLYSTHREEFLETVREQLWIKESKLSIFWKIDNSILENNKESNIEEENLYKIKLDFTEKWHYNENYDIKILVYKCKVLKNWKLSAGTKVKKSALEKDDVPKNIQKLKLFLDEAWNYRNYGTPWISFLDNPDYFLANLFEFNEVFNSWNNKIINIDKNIYDLKISVKKKKSKKMSTEGFSPLKDENNYEVKLVLNTKRWEVFFKNFKIIWEEGNNNYACLRVNWDLIFFKSDLWFKFISELNSGDLILNEEEFEQLQSSKYFENIISHSHKVEDLWIEKIIWEPKWKIVIEIDKDFENVKVDVWVNYWENKNLYLEYFDKKDFFVENSGVGNAGLHSLQKIIIQRNRQQEKIELEKLENLSKISDEKTEFWFTKIVDENIDDFFDEVEKLIDGWIIVDYAQPTKRVSNNELWLKVNVKSWVDFFDTNTALTIWDKEVEECAELLHLINSSRNKKSITLKNWMTILLKDDLTKSLDLLEEMWIEQEDIWKENVSISKHNIWLLKDKKSKWDLINFELDKETLKLKKSLTKFSWIRKVAVPENVKAELRDYQQTWYNWMNFLEKYNFSWILADDMWLWKTLQTLTLLQKMYNNKNLKQKSLVVCPTSLVFNWLDEAQKFTPDLKVEYIKDWKTAFTQIKKDTQVVIVSYWIIANLSEKWELKEKFHYLILDEAQNIKNPVAKRTKSICKIVSKYRLALSWTPIENNLMELWSWFNFLMPGFLNNLSNFKSKYMWAKTEKEAMANLSAKVKPFILRRKKEDVLKELPAKVEEVIKLDMWVKQKAFYTKLKNAFKLQINKELEEQWLNKARFKVLDSLLKLRQTCLTPQLIPWNENVTNESVKLDYIKNSIWEMLNNWHNLLIFSQFTGFLKYVREILEEKEIEYNYLDGQTPSKNRKWLVDEFNNWKKQVFIISLKAGWTGLNLTKADYVLHLDPWWNPAVENQATDRAHRMGQKKTVFVQKLICKDSIEEKILELQEKKKKLIDDVFSWNFSWSLSKEDIDFIFE